MTPNLQKFEAIVRRAHRFDDSAGETLDDRHPFEVRNIHSSLPPDTKKLFDNGHYAQATFEAFKFVDLEIQRISGDSEFGSGLMLKVFSGTSPKVAVNPLSDKSQLSEQEGYKFLFAGAMLAVRNPLGHKTNVLETLDWCLDHLAFASMLLRRLDDAGLR